VKVSAHPATFLLSYFYSFSIYLKHFKVFCFDIPDFKVEFSKNDVIPVKVGLVLLEDAAQ
jgi:hypothetical protein